MLPLTFGVELLQNGLSDDYEIVRGYLGQATSYLLDMTCPAVSGRLQTNYALRVSA